MTFYFLMCISTYWFFLGFQIGSGDRVTIIGLILMALFWPATLGATAYRMVIRRKEAA